MSRSTKPAVTLALLLTLLLGLPPAWGQLRVIQNPWGKARHFYLQGVERQIHQLTNEARRSYHLPPLDTDDALVATARAHSDDMLTRNFFNHVNPDGKAPQDRIAPAYSCTLARTGENIWCGTGYNYYDSKLVARVIMDSWMTSPGHRANLLNPDYTHLGVGVIAVGKEVRATQNFIQRQ